MKKTGYAELYAFYSVRFVTKEKTKMDNVMSEIKMREKKRIVIADSLVTLCSRNNPPVTFPTLLA